MSDLAPIKPTHARHRAQVALRIASVLTLIALALMAWAMLQPTPLPVMLAMTAGQLVGTVAFGIFLVVVVHDVRAGRKL